MDGGIRAVLLILSACVCGSLQECPISNNVQDYDSKCFYLYPGPKKHSHALTACSNLSSELPGEWRLPSIDELVSTGLNAYWVIGPDSNGCYGSTSTKEGKMIAFECNTIMGCACIQMSGEVKTAEEVQNDQSQILGKIFQAEDVKQGLLISEFHANAQRFEDLVFSMSDPITQKRKKRQAITGRRTLTGAQRLKIQSVKTRTRTQLGSQGSRTITSRLGNTRRVTSTRTNVANVPDAQDAPAEQVPLPIQLPAAGELPAQEGQVPSNEGNRGLSGRNRGFSRGGQRSETSEQSKTPKQERQGKEMCMGEWERFGDSCVYIAEDTLIWEEAKTACETFIYKESQATLVNLKEESTRTRFGAWLDRKVATTGRAVGPFWTSGNDLQEELKLQWTDDDPLVDQEIPLPDNTPERDCVVNMGTDGLKFDICSQRYQYVCQMKEPFITDDDLVR